jgi:hypothetical protein
MGEVRVVIPYDPREQFQPLHDRTQRWAVAVCHRRAGKTVSCVNELIKGALTCTLPEPRFAYVAPFYAQAKDVAWSYVKRFTAGIPGVVVNESELRVDLPNGGRIRLYGADNYDRLRGTYFDGIVLDEYGDTDPRAWQEVIRPALSDRKGWAVFIGTPKGRNHFSDLWDQASRDKDWFTLLLKASETGLIAPDELADARKSMSEDQYAAEYECSFQAAVVGAYYGREMQAAESDKRIGRVPWEPRIQVHTAWDLGIGDSTAIWFAQFSGREVRLIDYIENSGVGLDWYVRALRERPYVYGEHILPHDAEVKELGTGVSRVETLQSLGLHNTRIIPAQSVDDGINGVRVLLPTCWFDGVKCERGINALRNYRREYDEKLKAFKSRPLHDWSSHGADAFRYLALGQPQATDAWSKPISYPRSSSIV